MRELLVGFLKNRKNNLPTVFWGQILFFVALNLIKLVNFLKYKYIAIRKE